jgi:hypothetical protein
MDHGFYSPAYATEDMIVWQPGAAAYMRHTAELDIGAASRVRPPEGSIARIKRVLYRIIQDLIEEPLNTLRTGAGIL